MSNPFEKLAELKGRLPTGPDDARSATAAEQPSPFSGRVVVRKERKGRGGKTVTLVQGVTLTAQALEVFARDLKKALGCGASIEQGDVVLQGDLTDRVIAHLEKLGAKRVVRGSA